MKSVIFLCLWRNFPPKCHLFKLQNMRSERPTSLERFQHSEISLLLFFNANIIEWSILSSQSIFLCFFYDKFSFVHSGSVRHLSLWGNLLPNSIHVPLIRISGLLMNWNSVIKCKLCIHTNANKKLTTFSTEQKMLLHFSTGSTQCFRADASIAYRSK